MKKKLLVVLFVSAALVCMFASCGECEHNYEETSRVDATCAKAGSKTLKCSECGETKTETIPKTSNHKMTYEEIKATCLAGGKTVGTCSVCGYEKVTSETEKLSNCADDTIEDVISIPATCTTDGLMKKICSVCGTEHFVFEWTGVLDKIPALGHTYDRDTEFTPDEEMGITFVPGNCDTEGYFYRECKDCGYNEDPITREEYEADPKHDVTILDRMDKWGHSYTEYVDSVLPTCTENGYDIYKCTNEGCESEYHEVTAMADGHFYTKNETAEEGVHYAITLAPTCINTGTKAYICTTCGEVATDDKNIEVIPVVDHNIVDTDDTYLVYAMDATCTDAAYKIYKCCVDALCEETKQFTYGEKLDHNWVVEAEPSCATGGKTYYVCDRVCNDIACEFDKYDEPSIVANHTKGSVVAVPTCVDRAIYKCAVCEQEYSAYDGDEAGMPHGNHVYDIEKEVVPPSCSAEGYTIYGCSAGNCGTTNNDDYTTRTVHDFNPVTEDGRIVCVVCATQYRDVSTEITSGGGELCLGSCEGECTCDAKVSVEWNGYVSPKDPEAITANQLFTKTEVKWTEVEEKTMALALGKGMVVLNGEEGTTYEVKAYNTAGELVGTYNVSGEVAFVDLYKCEDVAKIEITASTDAVVYFYAIVE